jgi:hypothetical protein
MTPEVVGGDREEHRAVPGKVGEVLLVQGELLLGDRLPVGGIEHQNDATSAHISQGN